MLSSTMLLAEGGMMISIAILCDTFIIRIFWVPALVALFGEANWWPGDGLRCHGGKFLPSLRPAGPSYTGDIAVSSINSEQEPLLSAAAAPATPTIPTTPIHPSSDIPYAAPSVITASAAGATPV